MFQETVRQVLPQEEVEAGVHVGCGFVADEDGPVELIQDATDLGSGVPIMGTVCLTITVSLGDLGLEARTVYLVRHRERRNQFSRHC